MHNEPQVDDEYTATEFSFTNKHGGTGISHPITNIKGREGFTKNITVKVVHKFYDYECGWRTHCVPADGQPELLEYLTRNAAQNKKGQYILYVSQFDLVEKTK
jgi:hypothetical protein